MGRYTLERDGISGLSSHSLVIARDVRRSLAGQAGAVDDGLVSVGIVAGPEVDQLLAGRAGAHRRPNSNAMKTSAGSSAFRFTFGCPLVTTG